MRAAPAGTGIIAGGPMRAVFEALGVQDVVAKSVGTSNPHNMIKATFEALEPHRSARAPSPPSAARRSARSSAAATARPRPPQKESGSMAKKTAKAAGADKKTVTRHADRQPDRPPGDQRATLIGLGLNKLHRTRVLEDTPAVRGMIAKVKHLVRVEELTA